MNTAQQHPIVGVYGASGVNADVLANLVAELALPLINTPPEDLAIGRFVLIVDNEHGLSLQFCGRGVPGPIQVDFLSGASAHRRQFGGGKSQLIAKAVGIKGRFRPQVLDLTAGLGQDGFVLATLGCEVTLVERVGVVYQLLLDGLRRAKAAPDIAVQSIISRLSLYHVNGLDYLSSYKEKADVIYFDPMFPEREKAAKVKKSMAAFHEIVGSDDDAGEVLNLALQKAKYRVVVKRPRKAPSITQQYPHLLLPEPGLIMEAKSSRYDIYPITKMPTH